MAQTNVRGNRPTSDVEASQKAAAAKLASTAESRRGVSSSQSEYQADLASRKSNAAAARTRAATPRAQATGTEPGSENWGTQPGRPVVIQGSNSANRANRDRGDAAPAGMVTPSEVRRVVSTPSGPKGFTRVPVGEKTTQLSATAPEPPKPVTQFDSVDIRLGTRETSTPSRSFPEQTAAGSEKLTEMATARSAPKRPKVSPATGAGEAGPKPGKKDTVEVVPSDTGARAAGSEAVKVVQNYDRERTPMPAPRFTPKNEPAPNRGVGAGGYKIGTDAEKAARAAGEKAPVAGSRRDPNAKVTDASTVVQQPETVNTPMEPVSDNEVAASKLSQGQFGGRTGSPKGVGSHNEAMKFYSEQGAGARLDASEAANVDQTVGGKLNTAMNKGGVGFGADAARNVLASHIASKFASGEWKGQDRAGAGSEDAHHPSVIGLGNKIFNAFGDNKGAAKEFSSRVNTLAAMRKTAPHGLTAGEYMGVAEGMRRGGQAITGDLDSLHRAGAFDLAGGTGDITLNPPAGRSDSKPEQVNVKKLMRPSARPAGGGEEQTSRAAARAAVNEMDARDYAAGDAPEEKTQSEYADMAKSTIEAREAAEKAENESESSTKVETGEATPALRTGKKGRSSAAKTVANIGNMKGMAEARSHVSKLAAADKDLEKGRISPEEHAKVKAAHDAVVLPAKQAALKMLADSGQTGSYAERLIDSHLASTQKAADKYAGSVNRRAAGRATFEATGSEMVHAVDAENTRALKSGRMSVDRKHFDKHVDEGHIVKIDGVEHTVMKANKNNVHIEPSATAEASGDSTSTHVLRTVPGGKGVMAVPKASYTRQLETTRAGFENEHIAESAAAKAAAQNQENAQEAREGKRTNAKPVTKEKIVTAPEPSELPASSEADYSAGAARAQERITGVGGALSKEMQASRATTKAKSQAAFSGKGSAVSGKKPAQGTGRGGSFQVGTQSGRS